MSSDLDAAPQVTNAPRVYSDEELDAELASRPAPKAGWDNAIDIEAAKHFLAREWKSGIEPGDAGIETVFKIAITLRDMGISPKLAAKLISEICQPPVSRGKVWREVSRCYLAMRLIPGTLSRAVPPEDDRWQSADDDAWLEGRNWPEPQEYDPKQHAAKLADQFLLARPGKLLSSDGVLYSFESSVWRELPGDKLAAEIKSTDPASILPPSKITSMVTAIHMTTFTDARPFEWIEEGLDAPAREDAILFRNGIYDFKNERLLPHDGRYFATGLPEVDYDVSAECPTFDRFVSEVLHKDYWPTLYQWLGYLLTPDTSQEKLLALIGARRGGKSTLLRVIQWLVGDSHVMSRSLNDLGSDFGLEGGLDKRVLLIPDAHDTATNRRSTALDRLKAITGRDSVSINRKNQTIVTARLPMRIVIAANRMPKFIDESGALATRVIPLIFETSFEGREDRELSGKLYAELPGIAQRALQGLWSLRDRGTFTIGDKGRIASRELAESQSPALRFANAHVVITGNPDDCAPLAETFEVYEAWAIREGLRWREVRNRTDFKDDLASALLSRGVRYGRKRWRDPDGPQSKGRAPKVSGFFGARLKA